MHAAVLSEPVPVWLKTLSLGSFHTSAPWTVTIAICVPTEKSPESHLSMDSDVPNPLLQRLLSRMDVIEHNLVHGQQHRQDEMQEQLSNVRIAVAKRSRMMRDETPPSASSWPWVLSPGCPDSGRTNAWCRHWIFAADASVISCDLGRANTR